MATFNTAVSNTSNSSSSGTNFSAGGEDALTKLIQQLLSGGTDEQKAEANTRATAVQTVNRQIGDYSKQAAFADAQGAMSQQSRLALEKLIPAITRSAEGAGTSASSMRALLLQDSANKAAESAAALGLKASTDYGSIAAGLTGTLGSLAQEQNPVLAALMQAINLSKGSYSEGSGTGTSNKQPTDAYGNAVYYASAGGGSRDSPWDNYYARLDDIKAPVYSFSAGGAGLQAPSDGLLAATSNRIGGLSSTGYFDGGGFSSSVSEGNSNVRNRSSTSRDTNYDNNFTDF